MKVVIQCASRKNPSAGTLRTAGGKPVIFVAHPELAPPDAAHLHARPDDISDDGRSWRTRLPGIQPAELRQPARALLPAWQLYEPHAYSRLVDWFGLDCVFILSAGWGLIPARFLTPAYDITFSQVPKPERWKRRLKDDVYDDSCLMSNDGRPWVFLGGREYQPLLCRLTADISGSKTVFFRTADVPELPAGFTAARYETRRKHNWHYDCARDLIAGTLAGFPRGG